MIAITTLLKLLDKPALVYWANKIGLEGISLSEYRKKSTSDGTNVHKQVENYLLHKTPFEFSDKLDACLSGYTIVDVEKSFNNGFIACRVDLLIENCNEKIVVDFKSNNKIYLEHKLQLSTYKEILQYDKIAIINFEKWELEFINIDTSKYFNIVRFLYKIHEQLNTLNEKL